jgi:hypothetical protein
LNTFYVATSIFLGLNIFFTNIGTSEQIAISNSLAIVAPSKMSKIEITKE